MDATSSAYAAVGDYSSLSRDGHRNRDGSQHHIIGPASENLRREMSSLYWDGVRREVEEILLNLRGWQTEPLFAETILDDEKVDLIQGYDSFIDQISRHARDINERNDPLKSGHNSPKNSRTADISYSEALKQHGLDIYAVRQGYSLKKAVRDTLDTAEPDGDIWQRRALLLLQSAQFLDIDKLTEYRDVIKGASVWRRPAPPQLNLSFKKSGSPEFTPQRCSECTDMIRGSMYLQINEEHSVFCETCYREYHYGDSAITKKYKTCCLPSEATPQVEMICRCRPSKHKDDKGEPLTKWPLKPQNPSKCELFSLNRMLAEAKYAETRGKIDAKATLSKLRVAEFRGSKYKWGNPSQLPNLNSEFGTSLGRVDSVESAAVPEVNRG